MRETLRYRVGAWLQARPWARPFVLREDPNSGEFIDQSAHQLIRVRAINRINGRVLTITRQPNTWKGDGYIAAALIGAGFGAVALYGLAALFEALR